MKFFSTVLLMCFFISIQAAAQINNCKDCKGILLQAKSQMASGKLDKALATLKDVESCDYKNQLTAETNFLYLQIFEKINKQRDEAYYNKLKAEEMVKRNKYIFAEMYEERANYELERQEYAISWMYYLKALMTADEVKKPMPLAAGQLLTPLMYPTIHEINTDTNLQHKFTNCNQFFIDETGDYYTLTIDSVFTKFYTITDSALGVDIKQITDYKDSLVDLKSSSKSIKTKSKQKYKVGTTEKLNETFKAIHEVKYDTIYKMVERVRVDSFKSLKFTYCHFSSSTYFNDKSDSIAQINPEIDLQTGDYYKLNYKLKAKFEIKTAATPLIQIATDDIIGVMDADKDTIVIYRLNSNYQFEAVYFNLDKIHEKNDRSKAFMSFAINSKQHLLYFIADSCWGAFDIIQGNLVWYSTNIIPRNQVDKNNQKIALKVNFAFANNSQNFAKYSSNGELILHNVVNQKVKDSLVFKSDYEIVQLKYSPNDNYVIAGCKDGRIRLFNTKTGRLIVERDSTISIKGNCKDMIVLNKSRLGLKYTGVISATETGGLLYWQIKNDTIELTAYQLLTNDSIVQISYDYKNNQLLVLNSRNYITVIPYDRAYFKSNTHVNILGALYSDDRRQLLDSLYEKSEQEFDIKMQERVLKSNNLLKTIAAVNLYFVKNEDHEVLGVLILKKEAVRKDYNGPINWLPQALPFPEYNDDRVFVQVNEDNRYITLQNQKDELELLLPKLPNDTIKYRHLWVEIPNSKFYNLPFKYTVMNKSTYKIEVGPIKFNEAAHRIELNLRDSSKLRSCLPNTVNNDRFSSNGSGLVTGVQETAYAENVFTYVDKQNPANSLVFSIQPQYGWLNLMLDNSKLRLLYSADWKGIKLIDTVKWEGRNVIYSNVSLNGGYNYIEVDSLEKIKLNFTWELAVDNNDIYCPNCFIQFYVGLKDNFSKCFYSDKASGYTNMFKNRKEQETYTFYAPKQPGIYYITQRLTLEYSPKLEPTKHSNSILNAIAVIKVRDSKEAAQGSFKKK